VLVEQVIVIITIKMLLDEKKFINKKSLLNKEVSIEIDTLDSKN
jgi:hypothetical protein